MLSLDKLTEYRIRVKINKILLGNLGRKEPIEDGIYEFKLYFGPGYRIYYGVIGNDPDAFLLALQHVVKAQGISSIAEKSNKNRANLYKALSEEGNPYFRSIFDILKAIGMHFSIERNKRNLKHSHAV